MSLFGDMVTSVVLVKIIFLKYIKIESNAWHGGNKLNMHSEIVNGRTELYVNV